MCIRDRYKYIYRSHSVRLHSLRSHWFRLFMKGNEVLATCVPNAVAGGDGVQVVLIPRASSCALGFVRRPPSHLGARCTLIFVVHGHAYFPRALSPRWGSLHDMASEDSGDVGSNGRRILRIILNEVVHCCRSRPRLGLGKLSQFSF